MWQQQLHLGSPACMQALGWLAWENVHDVISFNPHNNNFQESTIIVSSQMRRVRSERSSDLSDVTQLKRGRANQGSTLLVPHLISKKRRSRESQGAWWEQRSFACSHKTTNSKVPAPSSVGSCTQKPQSQICASPTPLQLAFWV